VSEDRYRGRRKYSAPSRFTSRDSRKIERTMGGKSAGDAQRRKDRREPYLSYGSSPSFPPLSPQVCGRRIVFALFVFLVWRRPCLTRVFPRRGKSGGTADSQTGVAHLEDGPEMTQDSRSFLGATLVAEITPIGLNISLTSRQPSNRHLSRASVPVSANRTQKRHSRDTSERIRAGRE